MTTTVTSQNLENLTTFDIINSSSSVTSSAEWLDMTVTEWSMWSVSGQCVVSEWSGSGQ